MSHQAAPRPFSTSARVYPSYLPYLHTVHTTAARNKNMKWVTPAVAMAGVAGYAMASYRGTQTDGRLSDVSAADEAETQRRRQNMMLADAYGDRSSLAELEHALRVYETQQVPE